MGARERDKKEEEEAARGVGNTGQRAHRHWDIVNQGAERKGEERRCDRIRRIRQAESLGQRAIGVHRVGYEGILADSIEPRSHGEAEIRRSLRSRGGTEAGRSSS